MKGRLEHSLKTEEKINRLLRDLPDYVTFYYYEFKIGRQPQACLEYIRKINKFLRFLSNEPKTIVPSHISKFDITKFLSSIMYIEDKNGKRESSLAYRQSYHSVLKSFFDFLCENDYVDFSKNPMLKIKRAKGEDKVERIFLNEYELKLILDAVESGAGNRRSVAMQAKWKSRDKAILMILMQTGIRETALTEINIEDIDFDNHLIKSVIEKGHKDKTFTMSEQLEDSIKQWIYDRELIIENKNEDALFISKLKKRISQCSLAEIVAKYTKEALGYSVSPHKIRAAFANIMLKKTNENIYIVQQLLGHSRTETTKIYLDNNINQYNDMAAQIIGDSIFK